MTTRILRDALRGPEHEIADLLIVGGGITGAAIAYEAASRGLSVVLVERDDYGGATSAATGKLIHGGLRYLKNLEVGLVRESLAERRTLSLIAPGLVAPIEMVLPDPGLIERVGLTAYDLLSFDRNRVPHTHRIPAHRSLSAEELAVRGLGQLHRGILFHDAMMLSPERLALAFVRSALAHGARVANYARVDRLVTAGARVDGAVITDRVTGESVRVRARLTVNASGPWSHDLLSACPSTVRAAGPAPAVRSEGIYLVTRPITETMVLTVSGHGHFSFAPWRGRTLIGPTETAYRGPVDRWRLTRRAIEDFVAAINASSVVPVELAMDDVLAAYGGLRPLTETAGEDTYRASRASELTDHAKDGVQGLVSATGGKYTNSRAFAQKVVTAIARRLGMPIRASRSAHVPLDANAIADVPAAIAATARRARSVGWDPDAAALLTRLYGTETDALLALAETDAALAEAASDDGEVFAAVAYAARNESVVHLSDILLRRTGIGRRGDPGERVLARSAAIAADELGWDAERAARELADARAAVRLPEAEPAATEQEAR